MYESSDAEMAARHRVPMWPMLAVIYAIAGLLFLASRGCDYSNVHYCEICDAYYID